VRIAVISDIHGSHAALEAVIADIRSESPDVVVHIGDLALSGPRPAEVIDRVRELGWPGVVGNTDELLWRPDDLTGRIANAPRLEPLLRVLFERFAPATLEAIGQERLEFLRTLPEELRLDDDIVLLHASPGDLWRAPMPDADDAAFDDAYRAIDAGIVVYGHIHRPFVRRTGERVVANSGSVGMCYDGDPRASYILISDGDVRVKRVEYDVERDVADLHATGYPLASWLSEIRRTASFVAPPSGDTG
jgi:putative phosphoesterase